MALTLSPYAPRFTQSSLSGSIAPDSPLRNNPMMSRTVSINMDGLGDYNDTTEHFDSLDTSDMVADFGDGMGVDMNFGHADDEKVVDSELSKSSAMLTPTSTQMQLDATQMQLNQAQAALGGSHHPRSVDDMFHSETGLEGGSDDEDDSPVPPKRRRETQDVPGGFTYVDKESGESGRRKIRIEYITDKSRRHITFSKRKAGIMKKAYELSILTGTQVLLLVVSETGLVYTFTTTKLQPLVTKAEGKNLIQACLNAPDGLGPDGQPSGGPIAPTKGKNGGLSIRPHKLTAEASKAMLATAAQVAGATPDEAAAHATAQQEAVAQLGNGTPVSSRPKKRLPSKKRTASQHSIPDVPSAPELIPPVPPIPDMHRQHSPSTHLLPHQHAPPPQPPPNPLQSPLSAGYHMPQEYQHHAHPGHGVPSPTYAYPPTPAGGDYAAVQGYYPHAPPGHQGFVVHPGMYQSVPQPQQQQHGQQDRRMMPGGDGGMRMGM